MGGGGKYFTVTVTRKELVAAEVPMQEHWLPLSNLDLLLPPIDVSVFFCYKKPHQNANGGDDFTFGSMAGVLRKALAQALVSYYAFAGEVVSNSVGEPELLCNNQGVDFTEAYADVKLHDLSLYNPDDSIEGKLVPKKQHGVLCVQVTELKCGGLVVGCTFDHRIADAYSANMFLVSWAEMALCKPLSVVPSFRRSLLNIRRPGSYDPSLDEMYVLISALPPPRAPQPGGADPFINRIYYVTAEQLSLLQTLASTSKGSSYKRTKLESFSAFLWKMVAASAVMENDNKKTCKMGIVVDGRRRLSSGDEDKSAVMASYFGNVLSIPFGEKMIDELKEKPLSWVADAVHEYLEGAVTKEHFLGLIDWVEAHRPEPALAKIYCSGSSDGPAFVVSSGQRFAVSKVDFGWGRPALGSYHFPWDGEAGYVMPMPSPARDGDWVVYLHLLKGQIELIETEAAHVFRPLTSEYLNLIS
ncbi:shikimate O-hydroxycinnamoyltransferase-like [Vitis riparia]|uniref:shikimate O-hydroxycinnamoyltransferase-like n=1 Tax=Vitis riparia TaxID=96939 RepID=UPI00155B04D1|nr:shikimate O-hydroxycinnamoyltransferase-like [Vitis riparia]